VSDPISAAAARAFGGALGSNGLGSASGLGDAARKYVVDAGKGDGPSFKDTLARALGGVSEAQDTAADYMQKFVRGEPVELHQVMAATEEAGIALEMLVELRNKLTDAYKTVINMQS
jgi:flagellar hook-basal body complex protein FliE